MPIPHRFWLSRRSLPAAAGITVPATAAGPSAVGTNTALDGIGSTTAGSTASMWAPDEHQQPQDHHRGVTGSAIASPSTKETLQ